ncbi:hypothetical protein AVEN_269601-1 [Araneus ventricosus]|uniref:Uncharacterized protein n=1 Tax=Araneus ventricosus TaxID=182803 RepID=A0A4Y2CC86_ARAVE|nr:hypothetical protein AVEN_269601-1 [Araneus ventricosus]
MFSVSDLSELAPSPFVSATLTVRSRGHADEIRNKRRNMRQTITEIIENCSCADQLAKEAITKGDPFLLPKPLSYLKSEIKSAALSIWQDNWDNGETGRSTHDIVPRVSKKPVGWNREEIMFVTGHMPFPSYFHRFNLRTHGNCSCGEKGEPIHYATKCRFTLS